MTRLALHAGRFFLLLSCAAASFAFSGELARPIPPNAQVIRFTRFNIRYSLRASPGDTVQKVEFYITSDMGATWSLYGEDPNRASPMTIQVPGEGVYGFVSIATDRFGNRERAPGPGTMPETVVAVDRTPPQTRWISPTQDILSRGSPVEFKWEASDQNFSDAPVTIQYAADARSNHDRDASWKVLRASLPAAGSHAWTLQEEPAARYNFRLVAEDRAGNATIAYNPATLVIDASPPVTRGVSPLKSNRLEVDLSVDVEDPQPGSGIDSIAMYASRDSGVTWDLLKDGADAGLPLRRKPGETFPFPAEQPGAYALWPVAFDRAGNAGPLPQPGVTGPFVLVIDNEPPQVTLSPTFLQGRESVLANDTRVVEWVSYDPHSKDGTGKIHLSENDGQTWTELNAGLPGSGSGVVQFPFSAASDAARIKVTVEDDFGNVGEAVSQTFGLRPADVAITSVAAPESPFPSTGTIITPPVADGGGFGTVVEEPTFSPPTIPAPPSPPGFPFQPMTDFPAEGELGQPFPTYPDASGGSPEMVSPYPGPQPEVIVPQGPNDPSAMFPFPPPEGQPDSQFPPLPNGPQAEMPLPPPETQPGSVFPPLPNDPMTAFPAYQPQVETPPAPVPGAGESTATVFPKVMTTPSEFPQGSGVPPSPRPPSPWERSTAVPPGTQSVPGTQDSGLLPPPSSPFGGDSPIAAPPLSAPGLPATPPPPAAPGSPLDVPPFGSGGLEPPPLSAPGLPATPPPAAPGSPLDVPPFGSGGLEPPSLSAPGLPATTPPPAAPGTPFDVPPFGGEGNIGPPSLPGGASGIPPSVPAQNPFSPAPSAMPPPSSGSADAFPVPPMSPLDETLGPPPVTQPLPSDPRGLSNHYAEEARKYLDEGRVDLALASAERSVSSDSRNPLGQSRLAQVYVQQDPPDFARAATAAREAVASGQNDWYAWWTCADVFYRWAHARNKTIQAQIKSGERPFGDTVNERDLALENARIAISNSSKLVAAGAGESDREQVSLTQGEITYLRALSIPEPMKTAAGAASPEYQQALAAYKAQATPLLQEAIPHFQTAYQLGGTPLYREAFHLGIINFRLGGMEKDSGNAGQAAAYYEQAARYLEAATTSQTPPEGPREAYYMLAYCHDQLADQPGRDRQRQKEMALRYWRQTSRFYSEGTPYRQYADQRIGALQAELGS